MKDPLSYLTKHLLQKNNIRVDFEELDFQIKSHPSYPSLHAVTGVLEHFNIENLALDLPNTEEVFQQLPNSFIAQITKEDKELLVTVSKIKNDKVKIIFSEKEKDLITLVDFLKIFTGITVVVDKTSIEKSKVSFINSKLIKVTLGLIISVIYLGLLIINKTELSNIIFVSASAFGAFIAYNIIKYVEGDDSILGNKFCNNDSDTKSCNAVLNSSGAQITEDLKLSDLCLVYFTGLLLSSLLLSISNNSFSIIKLLSIIILPVTFYSIYYQGKVLKKWCMLCLGIVLVIWINAIIALLDFSIQLNLESISISLLSFTGILFAWLIYSKLKKVSKLYKFIKLEHLKFKRNFQLFNSLLKSSTTLDTKIDSTKEIQFGNPKALLSITIISNPMCGHCKPVHKIIHQILKKYAEEVSVTIRFKINNNRMNNSAVTISRRLLEIYDLNGEKNCLDAMNDIYGKLKQDEWIKKWHAKTDKNSYDSILDTQLQWCLKHGINFTPEILIDGKAYPKLYRREDLLSFIEDLIENKKSEEYSESSELITEVI